MTNKWLYPKSQLNKRYKCNVHIYCSVVPRVWFDGGAHGDDEAAHEQVGEEGGGQHEAQHDAVQAVQLHPAHNHPRRAVLCAAVTSSRGAA